MPPILLSMAGLLSHPESSGRSHAQRRGHIFGIIVRRPLPFAVPGLQSQDLKNPTV
jgi:hypothetical protein